MVSSFSNPGFPPVHAHPTRLPAMDARLSAAIDSFEASMRAVIRDAIRKVVDSTLAAIHKAMTPVLDEIHSALAQLRCDLALGVEGDSDPASMCSEEVESIEVGNRKPQNGDSNPLRIPSTIHDHSIPPLLSCSPLLRALASSAVIKPQSNNSVTTTISLLASKTVIHASTMTIAPWLILTHSFLDTTKTGSEVLLLFGVIACHTGHSAIIYHAFLNAKYGWVNWYFVGKFVKKDWCAATLFDEMSKRQGDENMTLFNFIYYLIHHLQRLIPYPITSNLNSACANQLTIYEPSLYVYVASQSLRSNLDTLRFLIYGFAASSIWIKQMVKEVSNEEKANVSHVEIKIIESQGLDEKSSPVDIVMFRLAKSMVGINQTTHSVGLDDIELDAQGVLSGDPSSRVPIEASLVKVPINLGYDADLLYFGNTCYMHSTIQFLHSVPELKSALIKYSHSERKDEGDQTSQLTIATCALISELDKGIQAMAPVQFWMVLLNKYPHFGQQYNSTFMQQDTKECWSQLLYTLSQSLRSSGSSESPDSVKALFGIELVSMVHCIESGENGSESVQSFISHEVKHLQCLHSTIETSSVLSSCVRQPTFILCTGGNPSAFTPTYSTLLIGTEPHSKRVKVMWKVQSDVLHGAIIGANQKHRCESCSLVQTILVQWVVLVQLHQHDSPKPTIFYLEQLILKHGATASAIESKALMIESLQRGVNQQRNSRVNYRQSRLRSIMMSSAKEIVFYQHFQHALQGGIDKLVGVVGLTFGPRGRNVVLDECGSPKVVSEGVKFGKAIELPHGIGTVGEARIREVFSKTNDFEGDKTTNTLKKGSECTRGTYLDLAYSLECHLEGNFGALAIDLHADFSLFFTRNKFDFWPVWDPGDTSAKAVKLILYFQYKDSKRMGAFVNLFWESSNGRDLLGYFQKMSEYEHRTATLEFDCDKKSMGVMVNSVSGKKSLPVKGDVENLLEKYTKVQLLDGTVVPLDDSSRNYIVQALHEMSTSALKPLNDAPVLKLADIGIAMGISGIENMTITRECAATFKQVSTSKFFSLVDKANFQGGSIVMTQIITEVLCFITVRNC